MPDVHPGSPEYTLHLQIEDVFVEIDASVHAVGLHQISDANHPIDSATVTVPYVVTPRKFSFNLRS